MTVSSSNSVPSAKPSLAITGEKIHPGMIVKLWHNPREEFDPALGLGERFRLVLVEGGTGIVGLGDRRLTFVAPVLFCLNEQESPRLEESLDLKAQALYFHPDVINSSFDFENVRHVEESDGHTHEQDRMWLRAFLIRNKDHDACLGLDPISAVRLRQQFLTVTKELSAQRDGFWPCRSRSYFLEILFLVDRIFEQQDLAEANRLADVSPSCDVDAIILYLHAHYQEKLSLDRLSQTFHTNRTTLTEQFRQATGQPVMSYLSYLRMRLASLMLRDTTVPVEEVMRRVGFSDRTHFGRTFRKHLGYSPSEYRQRYCWLF
jgi:AraC-like DNA-binding protein